MKTTAGELEWPLLMYPHELSIPIIERDKKRQAQAIKNLMQEYAMFLKRDVKFFIQRLQKQGFKVEALITRDVENYRIVSLIGRRG